MVEHGAGAVFTLFFLPVCLTCVGHLSTHVSPLSLYTAVVSGFLISVLGGSKVVIGGPTAAFIPIVVGIAHEYGPEVRR